MSEQQKILEPASTSTTIHADARTVWIPVGLATAVIIAVAGGSVWMNSQLLSINYSIMGVETRVGTGYDKLDVRLSALEQKITENQGEVRNEVRSWIRLFAAQNKDRTDGPMEFPKFP